MEQEELARDVEKERAKSWRRPEPPPHDPDTDTLVFQQIEIDFYIGKFGKILKLHDDINQICPKTMTLFMDDPKGKLLPLLKT